MNSPEAELPECETRSVSVKPGVFTSQESVLMGMWMFEQSAGFGASVESVFELAFFGLEPPVDGGGADREQLLLGLGRDSEALLGPREP